MNNMSATEWEELKELLGLADTIVKDGLGRLRQMDEEEKIDLWNRVVEKQTTFREKYKTILYRDHRDIGQNSEGKFCFAKLLLAAAAHLNNEEESPLVDKISDKELAMVEDLERFSVFAISSPEKIAERIARRGDIYDLVIEFYQGGYSNLDRLLEDTEIPQDLRYFLSHWYEQRLDKIKKGVQVYVDKYGPIMVVSQIEKSLWDKIKQSEEERENITENLRERIAQATSKLKSREEIEREGELFADRLRGIEKDMLTEREAASLTPLASEKQRLVGSYLGFEKEIGDLIEAMEKKQQQLVTRQAELERVRQESVQQMQEQRKKVVESELKEIQSLRSELASQARGLQEEKSALELKREEINEKLRQITEIHDGKPTRFIIKDDAKLCELNFLSRFDRKMHELPLKVFSPVENKTFVVNSWGPDSGLHTSEVSPSSTYLTSESIKYVVSERRYKIFGEKLTRAVIEAVSFSNSRNLAEYGFDVGRANKSHYLELVLPRKNKAEVEGYLHIIALASPTGWDEVMIKELSSESFAQNYVSQYLSVCLVDSLTGEIWYNPLDKRITQFVNRFKPEFEEEEVEGLKKKALEELRLKGSVVLDDFAREAGTARRLTLKALYDLEQKHKVQMRVSKEFGVVFELKN